MRYTFVVSEKKQSKSLFLPKFSEVYNAQTLTYSNCIIRNIIDFMP